MEGRRCHLGLSTRQRCELESAHALTICLAASPGLLSKVWGEGLGDREASATGLVVVGERPSQVIVVLHRRIRGLESRSPRRDLVLRQACRSRMGARIQFRLDWEFRYWEA